MNHTYLSVCVAWILAVIFCAAVTAADPDQASAERERATGLVPDLENGRRVYALCATCHLPEGWGLTDGTYPQIAGQIPEVLINALADIRTRVRNVPIMLPFATFDDLTPQQIADVAAYISLLPMTPRNGIGPGTDVEHGKRLFEANCAACHGDQGQGDPKNHVPVLYGQHYAYLLRQFHWIQAGLRCRREGGMARQAGRFSPRDVVAVTDYISRLRPPPEKLAPLDWHNPDFPQFHRPALHVPMLYEPFM